MRAKVYLPGQPVLADSDPFTICYNVEGTYQGTINQATITVTVVLNGTPPSEFAGTMDIEEYGDRLQLVFSGYTSAGFLTAEFVVTRA